MMRDSSMFIVEHIGGGSMAIYMKDTGQRVAVYQLSSSATYKGSDLFITYRHCYVY